jgi:hypothetical protein
MTARTRTAKKTTPADPGTAPAKKAAARPARKRTTRKPAAPSPAAPKLSLVKPPKPLPARDREFVTDAQIYATHAARTAGLPVHRIREWTDHHDGTATRLLTDGYLHYAHPTRTLTWRTSCRMGAFHTYVLDSPSTAARARVQAANCEELHADLSTVQPLTGDELEALGLLQTPTWARPDLIGDDFTDTKPIPAEPVLRAASSAADTQPMSKQAIAEGLAARAAADNDTAKEHPQP